MRLPFAVLAAFCGYWFTIHALVFKETATRRKIARKAQYAKATFNHGRV
jgi:hypothetical protein